MTDCGFFGGHIADIPKPHRRYFDDRRRKRDVEVSICDYLGIIGKHFYAVLTEEFNPLWNAKEKRWQQCWDDDAGRGSTLSKQCYSRSEAEEWCHRAGRKAFKRHRFVHVGQKLRWFYRDGD